jgi:outer membrane protein OmpA-like peptidoglycan-associated protein
MHKGFSYLLSWLLLTSLVACTSTGKSYKVPKTSKNMNQAVKRYKVPKVPYTLDADGDGVENHKDKCPNTQQGQTVSDTGCSGIEKIPAPIFQNINFGYNKASLIDGAHQILDHITLSLKAKPEIDVEVQGHTDSSKDRAYNQKLSLQRAKTVKAYLVEKGIDKERIHPTAYGQDRPIADNKTAKGRAMNRRVQTIPII